MNWRLRFLQWIAEPVIARLREELGAESFEHQQKAYALGRIHGEVSGQSQMADALIQVMNERGAVWPDFTAEDIERAKKGMVH